MRIRTLTLATVAIASMGVTVLSSAASASAAPAPVKARHCVMNVATGTTACYANFTKALAAATGGAVTDAPADAAAAVKDSRLAARLNASAATKKSGAVANRAAADIVIGIEYEDSDYEDSTLTYSAPSGCTGPVTDVDWVAASLPSGWNDEIGSYQGYGGCWAKHFEHINYGGASFGFDSGRSDMGVLDDEASSIQWS
jgi:hypothetical protein